MAFAAYATTAGPPPAATAVERLLADSLVIASAGNDATSRRTYPAALPGVVAVAALDVAGRAAFSNFGPWVDACTPAVDVVSTFFDDVDDRAEDGELREQYRGWARWSGTSFAAPKVAGVIAQELYLHGGTAHDAWARIRARAGFHLPDLGVLVNC
jgi:subtilisin family serine protease